MRQSAGWAPPLVVRFGEHERSLPPGPAYRVGRAPDGDVVIADSRVSRRHAVLRLEEGTWVLADDGSANGTFVEGRRVSRVQINGKCQVVLGHPICGAALSCALVTSTESCEKAAHRLVVAHMPVVASRRARAIPLEPPTRERQAEGALPRLR
jgi:predicted component of type VI protein secretion system